MRCAILGFIGGAAWLQAQAALPTHAAMLLLLAASLALAGCAVRWSPLRLPAVLLAGCALGFCWAALVAGQALAVGLAASDEGRDLEVTGTVDSLPYRFDGGVRFNFAVASAGPAPARVVLSWYAAQGRSQAAVPELRPGQRWQLRVRLQRPHGNANPFGFDYELWLLEQGIRATGYVRSEGRNERLADFAPSPHNAVERARYGIRERIAAALQGRRYAGVIAALAMGDQRGISQQDWQVFSRTGIAHLVSISGLHITMIAGLVAWLAGWLWRRSFFMPAWQLPLRLPAPRVAVLAGLLAAWAYVALAGFGVPAQRTLYMLAVVALAMWLGRLAAISHVLALAAGVVVLLDPWSVMWPGFWLSFGAVAVILYATVGRMGAVRLPTDDRAGAAGGSEARRPAQAWRARQMENLRLAAVTQFAVTAGLVPLTMLLFSQVSLASPLANAIAIPVISLLVTPLALLGSVLPQSLAEPVLLCAHWILELLLDQLHWLSAQPLAVWSAPAPDWPAFAFALAGTAWMLAPRGWPMRWLGLACWLPLLAAAPKSPPPGMVRVIAFDVGQGMALLVETASHRLLYDTGPSYTPEANGGNRVVLPYLRARGITALDAMLVSHSDNDHSGGALAILREVRTTRVLSSLAPGHDIIAAASRHESCVAGQAWEWDGVRFEMLHPAPASYGDPTLKPNARGCTLSISSAHGSILLAADIEAAQEEQLVATMPEKLRADILLVPHHGSGTSSTPSFLAAVQPRQAIFQLGYRNRYRHPRADVLERYRALDAGIWRTDQDGAISMELGPGLALGAYRQQHPRYWYGR